MVLKCADTLVSLSLSHNHISCLPPQIGVLRKLRRLVLSHNQIGCDDASGRHGAVPTELAELRELRFLDLQHNSLGPALPSRWPPTQLPKLEVLNLGFNGLSAPLPEDFATVLGSVSLSLRGNPLLQHTGRAALGGGKRVVCGIGGGASVRELRV